MINKINLSTHSEFHDYRFSKIEKLYPELVSKLPIEFTSYWKERDTARYVMKLGMDGETRFCHFLSHFIKDSRQDVLENIEKAGLDLSSYRIYLLEQSCRRGDQQSAQYFIEKYHIDLDKEASKCFEESVGSGNTSLMDYLLSCGAHLNENNGRPLQTAVTNKNLQAVRFLTSRGVKLSYKNYSSLLIASADIVPELLTHLIEYGYKIEPINKLQKATKTLGKIFDNPTSYSFFVEDNNYQNFHQVMDTVMERLILGKQIDILALALDHGCDDTMIRQCQVEEVKSWYEKRTATIKLHNQLQQDLNKNSSTPSVISKFLQMLKSHFSKKADLHSEQNQLLDNQLVGIVQKKNSIGTTCNSNSRRKI